MSCVCLAVRFYHETERVFVPLHDLAPRFCLVAIRLQPAMSTCAPIILLAAQQRHAADLPASAASDAAGAPDE